MRGVVVGGLVGVVGEWLVGIRLVVGGGSPCVCAEFNLGDDTVSRAFFRMSQSLLGKFGVRRVVVHRGKIGHLRVLK